MNETTTEVLSKSGKKAAIVSKTLLVPFILITFCFSLWGFANDITNPLVKAFGTIFTQSTFLSSFVQFAFYGGYCFMAIPAAIFIKKYSYKSGILVGLGLYAFGGLLFIPASLIGFFWPFCAAFFIMTCGLSFLETSANPYILSMGDDSTATQRLNLAQSFNPMGSIIGIIVAKDFILAKMDKMSSDDRTILPIDQFEALKMQDLAIVRAPYVAIGAVILIMFVLIFITKMPKAQDQNHRLEIWATIKRLFNNIRYREGVIAQAFYVGAQITVWTYTVHYGTQILMGEGLIEADASTQALDFSFYAMLLFASSRFVCTFLLKYLKPGTILLALAVLAVALLVPVIFVGGRVGLYSLVAVSGCMSLMFPTIYGIALKGIGEDAKLGAAGLVMAIAGGSILPPVQALLIDHWTLHYSFAMPLVCFIVVAWYGYRTQSKFDA